MEKSFGQGDPALSRYAEDLFKPIDAVLADIRIRSKEAGLPEIQVGAMDGRHLQVLSLMIGASKAVEIGTLGGYSGVCIARGMRPGGLLHTFEKNETHAAIAKSNLERALSQAEIKVETRVHVGAALEMLPQIENDGPFDLVFIDADKPNYPNYLDWAFKNLRVGGVVIADNTFAWGQVHRTSELSGNDKMMVGSLHEYNCRVAGHPKLCGTILPTAEGLTVAVKVSP